MDRTMVDMCAFVGGSTKLGVTPGGGGPDGVLLRSMFAKSMADTAHDCVPWAVKLKTRQERVSRNREKGDVLFDCLRRTEHLLEGEKESSS